MRKVALTALAAGMAFALAGAAQARPWTDPSGRVALDSPNGWSVMQEFGNNPAHELTYVIIGTAAHECQIKAWPNPNSAQASPFDVHYTASQEAQFGADYWVAAGNSMPGVFPNNSAQFVSRSQEADGPWPIQRATMTSGERTVHAALQLRPGFDILTMCMTYEGSDPMATYNAVIRSVSHPNDATWLAAIGQERDARAAAIAAAESEAAQPAQEEERPPTQSSRTRN